MTNAALIYVPQIEDKEFDFFTGLTIFKGLSKEQCFKIYSMSNAFTLEKGFFLMHEGDVAEDLFVIMEGSLEVFRYDKEHNIDHTLAFLETGEIVGEIAVLDNRKRTASIRANTTARILKIPFKNLISLAEKEKDFYSTFYQLSINLARRVHASSESTVKAIQSQLEVAEKQAVMGTFFINIVSVLCLFVFSLNAFKYIMEKFSSSTFATMLMLIIFMITMISICKKAKLPREMFGLTTLNWKKSIIESIAFTIPILIGLICLKWIFIHYCSFYHNKTLFEMWWPERSIVISGHVVSQKSIWLVSIVCYIFAGCFLQEFLARGTLQSPLNYFLKRKHKSITALLVTNLIFSTLHLLLDAWTAMIVFLPGMYFGWLFIRHKNLIGCTIAHVLIGTLGLFFIGV